MILSIATAYKKYFESYSISEEGVHCGTQIAFLFLYHILPPKNIVKRKNYHTVDG